ncbi:ATP-binding protein [Gloeobacter kilaueensis]|uniref:Histidine kinase n=1 Tax=Gloeobacter kilaueensis (strain ATCC BAA-2537 / CCAP 1431/1 / ULC 316 / JS1) TaxID=1183438 RepID=U5QI03_GLOK1|nr:ATP-binding protein [Gloeobacter kilaueensis]AGY57254.1 histidine kinase [Gloeobacter kilaueensis JS1]
MKLSLPLLAWKKGAQPISDNPMPFLSSRLTLMLMVAVVVIGIAAIQLSVTDVRRKLLVTEQYMMEGDLIQFETVLAAKQKEIENGLQHAYLRFKKEGIHTDNLKELVVASHLNFISILDDQDRIVGGASRILRRSEGLSKNADLFGHPVSRPDKWLPTYRTPVPFALLDYEPSAVQRGAQLRMGLLQDAHLNQAGALSNFELLDWREMAILGIDRQAGYFQPKAALRSQVGLAIVAIQPLVRSGKTYRIVAGYLINNNPELVDQICYLTGKPAISIAAGGYRISTTLAARGGWVRLLGQKMPGAIVRATLEQAGPYWGVEEIAGGRYAFGAVPLYDHRLKSPRIEAAPIGMLEIGVPMAEAVESRIKLSTDNIYQIGALGLVTVVVFGGAVFYMIRRGELNNCDLHQSKDLILESAANGILGFNQRGQCTFANSAALELLRWTAEECILQKDIHSVLSLLYWSDEKIGCQIEQFDLGNTTQPNCSFTRGDAWLLRAGGKSVPVEVKLTRASHPSSQVSLVLTLTNLEERQRAEKQGRLAAVLGERNRMASEIHDNLANIFAGLMLQIKSILSALQKPTIAEEQRRLISVATLIQNTAQYGLQEMRRSLWLLRPDAVGYSDLSTSLQQCIERLSVDQSFHVEFHCSGTPYCLDDAVEKELQLLGQEALTNACKHAAAQRISVSLTFEPDQLTMRIQDDGCGFDLKGYNHRQHSPQTQDDVHFGLFSMFRRAEEIGGQLVIDTAVGQGTTITVCLPIAACEETRGVLDGSESY